MFNFAAMQHLCCESGLFRFPRATHTRLRPTKWCAFPMLHAYSRFCDRCTIAGVMLVSLLHLSRLSFFLSLLLFLAVSFCSFSRRATSGPCVSAGTSCNLESLAPCAGVGSTMHICVHALPARWGRCGTCQHFVHLFFSASVFGACRGPQLRDASCRRSGCLPGQKSAKFRGPLLRTARRSKFWDRNP